VVRRSRSFHSAATFNRRRSCNRQSGQLNTQSRADQGSLQGIRKLPNGQVFYIDPAVIDTATGRAVGADNLGNTAAFTGQVFFNPIN
jgi:hypothetical protein